MTYEGHEAFTAWQEAGGSPSPASSFALSAFSAYSEAVPQAEQISDDFAALSWTGGSGKGSSAAAMYAGAEALYCATGRERVKKLCAADAANDDLRGKVSSFSLPDAKKGESASGAVFYGEKRRELYFVLRSQSGEDCRVLQVSIGDAAARAGKAVVSECSAERFTVPQVPEVSPLPPENIWGGVKVRGAILSPRCIREAERRRKARRLRRCRFPGKLLRLWS